MYHNRMKECQLDILYQKRRVYSDNKENVSLFQDDSFLNELERTINENFFEIDKSFKFNNLTIDILPYEIFIYKTNTEKKPFLKTSEFQLLKEYFIQS